MNGVLYFIERDLTKWTRSKVSVVASLAMPAAWLIFVGLTLPIKFNNSNYIDYITPGILVMTMLFASLAGGSLLIFDKMLGFLNKFLALPTPRESILFGKILFITFRGIIQSTVILVLALFLGVKIQGLTSIFLIYLVLFIFGILFSSISTTIALVVDDHDGYAAVNSMISMPLFFTSSALMPYDMMPSWLRILASLNPVSYAIDTARALFTGNIPLNGIVELIVITVVVLVISVYTFRRATV
ncbi:MAG: ABC transporter permease [Euryarchaeota archaeon]|nr:ABC transporter permease [Euryarchaeota archaeon]MBU4340208.1 ABC transporter permease [Euryarchaeota archaeon]MBU4453989.1 ABC transporter permease [Euryarchaeota archaeon]MCG2736320.1 ABC transporter permease [Candidatus Methanoperedenaceae archaeon]